MIRTDPHPLLDARAFTTHFAKPLGEQPSPDWLAALLALPAQGVPFSSDEAVRGAIRDLLRHGGYKPTGRGKPASEYLLRAVGEGALKPINAAVDCCNVASLHSGLPISVVDLDRTEGELKIALGTPDAHYVFNASGQEIDVEGLLCLHDARGACANAVKDSQRTKTHPGTSRTVSVIWGSKALGGRAAETARWYRELLERLGATTEEIAVS